MYGLVTRHAKQEDSIAGSFFWSAIGSTMPDHDGFSVRLEPPAQQQRQQSAMAGGPKAGACEAVRDSAEHAGRHPPSGRTHGWTDSEGPVLLENGPQQGAIGSAEWPDVMVVRLIKAHGNEMVSLSGGWGQDCIFM